MVTSARASADGTRATQVSSGTTGTAKAGGPAATSPSASTPWPGRSSQADATVPSTITTSAHGTTGRSRRPTSSTSSDSAATPADQAWACGSSVISATTLAKKPRSCDRCRPSILATWLIRISTASPDTKPIRIGRDRKLAR